VLIGLRGRRHDRHLLDTIPNAPSPCTETVAMLQRKLAELAIGDAASGGTFRPQVVHF
jgi:hypothetical protein